MKRITVVGAGYVGLANAIALAQRHAVTLLDIDPAKIDAINRKTSPIADPDDADRRGPLRALLRWMSRTVAIVTGWTR